MDRSAFRVTASTGGWRSLPWPFAIVEVSDTQLSIRSTGWSWWVPDRSVDREKVKSITIQKSLGTTKFSIAVDDSPSISLRPATSASKLRDSLSRHGYPPA